MEGLLEFCANSPLLILCRLFGNVDYYYYYYYYLLAHAPHLVNQHPSI